MTDTDDPAHRLNHRATGDDITVRDADEVDDEDGVFELRMPIATTGDVRNEGDDPLTREELDGMSTQINDREIGVFPAHGGSDIVADSQYSPFEKLGVWESGAIDSREDDDVLMATARMADPEELPAATGDYRQALAILKEQAKRGIAQDASIGWRDDESFVGGVDLMEVSIVGIGADWRTNTGDEQAEVVARAAVEAGVDADDLVARVRSAVDRATDTVDGTDIDVTPPEAVVNAAEAAKAAKEEYDDLSECGTGDGMESARKIIDDDLTAEYVADEIAAYLSSHADDVDGIDSPPTEWDEDTWTDGCGPVQYALWGGTATGTGREWAQGIANEVAEAKGDDLPYPNRNLDDPAYGEGDAVEWTWDGEPVHGRVADVGDEFTVSGNTITGDDGEAVYLIHEWDEGVEAFRSENVAKPESSLSPSEKDMPAASEDTFASMSDDDTGDDPGTTDGEQDAPDDGAETTRMNAAELSDMVEDLVMGHIEQAMDELEAELTDAMDGDGENKTDEDGDEDGEDDEDDEEQSADDPDSEQSADDAGEHEERIAELEDTIEELRAGDTDVETPETPETDTDAEQDADADDGESESTDDTHDAESPTNGLGDYR